MPVALACAWAGDGAWGALVAFGAAGLAWEWVTLFGLPLHRFPGCVVPVAVVLATVATAAGLEGWALAALAAGSVAAFVRQQRTAFASGVLYVGLACAALIWLRADAVSGWPNLLFLLGAVWASDIGAYAVGRFVGGPKLAPAISPGKTWSGSVGGLVIAAGLGEAVGQVLHGSPPGRAALVAALLAFAAQVGDLGESALKRHFGVKDSGWLIPGHGGLLDRLDGVLIAAPVAALVAMGMGRGMVLWQ